MPLLQEELGLEHLHTVHAIDQHIMCSHVPAHLDIMDTLFIALSALVFCVCAATVEAEVASL